MVSTVFRRGDPRVKRWLVLLLAIATVFVGEFVAMLRGVYTPPVTFLSFPLFFLIGPVLWQVCRLLAGEDPPGARFLPHLLPAALAAVDLAPYYAAFVHTGFATPGRNLSGLGGYGMSFVQLGQTAIYVAAAARALGRYERGLRDTQSGAAVARARWIRILVALFGGIVVLAIATFLVMRITGRHLNLVEYALAFAFAATILAVGEMLLHQPEVLAAAPAPASGSAPASSPSSSPNAPETKYRKSLLDDSVLEEQAVRLLDFFETRKPWLDPNLGLADLARNTRIPAHHLSQVFSRAFGSTFFDFVNSYRVREAARRLVDARDGEETILAVAFDSGFSSKASFNRIFKARTGFTPSRFRAEGRLDHDVIRDLVPAAAIPAENGAHPTG
ncbi:MAG: helix-turn-helix transcriptional regulator [bacterium]